MLGLNPIIPDPTHLSLTSLHGSVTIMLIPTTQTRLEVNRALEIQGLKRTGDEKNLVGWAAMNPRHPRNWSSSRKGYDVTIIIFLEFYTWVFPFRYG